MSDETQPTTLKVSWHPDAILAAHERLIAYRDWIDAGDPTVRPPMLGRMDACAAADCIRACGAATPATEETP